MSQQRARRPEQPIRGAEQPIRGDGNMIVLKKRHHWAKRNGVAETYYFVDPDRLDRDDGSRCRCYMVSVWEDKSIFGCKTQWFPLYALNMTIYEETS